MEHITGTPREQIELFPEAIQDYVSDDNPVRFIDAFVDGLDMVKLGFEKAELARTGTPPYWPGDLLKLYLYGYLNRIRSSRRLELETRRNLEVMWLLRKLSPDHKTISDFRRDNRDAIRAVCKNFVVLCQGMDLFGRELVAIDGSKFRASNSKRKNFTKKELKERLKRIERNINEYLKNLETNDREESHLPEKDAGTLDQKIRDLKERQQKYNKLMQELEETGQRQISLTDKDARQMVSHGKAEVCYNLQTVVDEKYKMIPEHELTTDVNDKRQLSSMAIKAKGTLGADKLEVVADKGYTASAEIKRCEEEGITPYVPVQNPIEKRKSNVPTPDFYHSKFQYDKERDLYLCPQNQELKLTHKTWLQGHWVSIYITNGCRGCKVRSQCTVNKQGRRICRSEDEEVLQRMRERISEHPEKLKQRKCLSEHPFGTIKHTWNQGCFLLRGLENVRVEASLSILAYNMRRAMTVLGVPALLQHLSSA